MMYYPPPYDNMPIKPEEQKKREKRYKERIGLAIARYEHWKIERGLAFGYNRNDTFKTKP